MAEHLIAGEDYYEERGLFVFTARYHLKRGYCCGSGCRHCPYNADGSVRPEVANKSAPNAGSNSSQSESSHDV
jgi:hypothetical protein